jgi:hypothetical protein
MQARGSDQPDVIDVIGSDPPAPRRITAGLALVLVVVAALAGYLVGRRHHGAAPAPAPVASATPGTVVPVTVTDKQCSIESKGRLQLGIEIVNRSAAALTLDSVDAILPLRGLRATTTTWGTCGQLPPPAGDIFPVAAGGTGWLTVTFDVLVACPAPLPVQFRVHYTQAGTSGIADLPGFNDLGDVPYTGGKC